VNTLLAVCSANICRTPLALAALDTALVEHGIHRRITMVSRGDHAETGMPVCDHALQVARRHGIRTRLVDDHRATALDRGELSASDLILTADRTVRANVLKLDPRASERTFTFREAAALARLVMAETEGDRSMDLAGFASALNDNRGLTDLPSTKGTLVSPWRLLRVHSHDVPDAHVDRQVSHRVVYRALVPAVQELVRHLAAYASPRGDQPAGSVDDGD
jgi:protein-tyrosine phosphatase